MLVNISGGGWSYFAASTVPLPYQKRGLHVGGTLQNVNTFDAMWVGSRIANLPQFTFTPTEQFY